MAHVMYFEIPATDLDRAAAFYEAVFDIALMRTEIDGHPMALFPDVDGGPGATGSIATGESYVPSVNGTRVYFGVDDIDLVLERVIAQGGEVLYPKTSIGELGHVAEFRDSEGNRVALSSN
jgi:predicted enzyme related to lactoylglutathione lyase